MLPALQPATNTRRVGHPPEHPVEGGAGVGVAAVVDRDRRPAGPVGADGVAGVDVAGAGGDEQHRPAPERVAGLSRSSTPDPSDGSSLGSTSSSKKVDPARTTGSPSSRPALEEHQQPVRRPHPRPEREPAPRAHRVRPRARPVPRPRARPRRSRTREELPGEVRSGDPPSVHPASAPTTATSATASTTLARRPRPRIAPPYPGAVE